MEIRVAIFEDNKMVRDAFEAIISGTAGFCCTGSFGNASDLLYSVRKSNPDVVLMDIEMPGISGIEATSQLQKYFPDIRILIQTVFDEDEKIFASICAGASGYVLKDSPPSRLLEAIQEVYNGGAPMSPAIATRVLHLFQKFAPPGTGPDEFNLSKREKEILAQLVEGLSFKEIAAKNFIGYETVRTHVKKIYKKLHVANMTDAVVKAIRHGLV